MTFLVIIADVIISLNEFTHSCAVLSVSRLFESFIIARFYKGPSYEKSDYR